MDIFIFKINVDIILKGNSLKIFSFQVREVSFWRILYDQNLNPYRFIIREVYRRTKNLNH